MPPPAEEARPPLTNMHACSPAQSALNRMAQAMTQPPTWRQVAVHELKRALVYVPILMMSAYATVWMNRKKPGA